MSRFNFAEITRNSQADILDVVNNFNEIEQTAAIIDDLPKVKTVTITTSNWVSVNSGRLYRYTLSDSLIKVEPYNIELVFSDITLIKSAIYPKANSQANGSIILETKIKPIVDLTATLIVTKGVTA